MLYHWTLWCMKALFPDGYIPNMLWWVYERKIVDQYGPDGEEAMQRWLHM